MKNKKSTYKLKAHDEENKCRVGDTIKVMETRPLSKDKRWRVVEIVRKGSNKIIKRKGGLLMVQQQTILKVADNTGAKKKNNVYKSSRWFI